MMQDPICGMPVGPDSPFSAEHGGRQFRFCSAFCRHAFVRDPDRALSTALGELVSPDERTIAYFSMELALDPRMPTYSGGLGVLAGDTLRSCADLGPPRQPKASRVVATNVRSGSMPLIFLFSGAAVHFR